MSNRANSILAIVTFLLAMGIVGHLEERDAQMVQSANYVDGE